MTTRTSSCAIEAVFFAGFSAVAVFACTPPPEPIPAAEQRAPAVDPESNEKPPDEVLASSPDMDEPNQTGKETDKMTLGLRGWIDENSGSDKPRTAIVRAAYSSDLEQVVRELEAAGAVVESAGPGAVTIQADAAVLERIVELEWLVALEEPRRMELKLPNLSPDN